MALEGLRPELTVALRPERFLRETEIATAFQPPHFLPFVGQLAEKP